MTLRRAAIAQKQVLMVSGDIELGSLPRFNDSLSRLVTDDAGHVVVVDVAGTAVIEDAALGLILGAAGPARAVGGDIEIVCTDARLRQRFAENGFDRAVTVNQSIH